MISIRTISKLRLVLLALLLMASPLAGSESALASRIHLEVASVATPLITVSEVAAREALLKQAKIWVNSLSQQEAFASWKQAKLNVQALGPGTHGWLITVQDNLEKPIGYLVAYAAPDRTYRLGEYGLGEQPLFDQASLKRSLYANGLIDSLADSSYAATMLYAHPFAAVWKVTIGSDSYWLDAKSDELLPLDPESWDSIALGSKPLSDFDSHSDANPRSVSRTNAGSKSLLLNEPFDPYERLPWLQNEKPFPASDEAAFLKRLSANEQLRYVSEPFGDKMLYALSVIGYHQWMSGRLDAALDMNGIRFISLDALRQLGQFYK